MWDADELARIENPMSLMLDTQSLQRRLEDPEAEAFQRKLDDPEAD